MCPILSASLLAACFEMHPTVPPSEPSRDPTPRAGDQVAVLDGTPTEQPFVAMGPIGRKCADEHAYPNYDAAAILACYREEAARHGCDAIVVEPRSTAPPVCIAYVPYGS